MASPSSSSNGAALLELSHVWNPIRKQKGSRAGLHSVKYLGPNTKASLRLFQLSSVQQEATATTSAASTGRNESSSVALERVAEGAPQAVSDVGSFLQTSPSESPVGFFVWRSSMTHHDAVPLSSPSGSSGAAAGVVPSLAPPLLGLQVDIALATEPGTLVWCCDQVPNRQELLEYLVQLVQGAQWVTATRCTADAWMLPNHLVIAPHNWPLDAPKKAEQELTDWLFKLEPTFDEDTGGSDRDAASRNNMRIQIHASFLSTTVFAFPDVESTQQHRERTSQFLRGRWGAGCLEGWGMIQASTGVKCPAPFVPDTDRIFRIQRLFATISGIPSLMDADEAVTWLENQVAHLVEHDFAQYCAARTRSMTADQARELHHSVLMRCNRLCDVTLPQDAAMKRKHRVSEQLEAALQSTLIEIHTHEEKSRTSTRTVSGRGGVTIGPERIAASDELGLPGSDIYFPAFVQRWVPRAHWYWFTAQGLGVAFVFLTLAVYMFWPRASGG